LAIDTTIGIGLQVVLYSLALASDWNYLLAGTGRGLISRELAETMLSGESPFVPRIGWLVTIGHSLGLTEDAVLTLVWIATLCAGLFLLAGIFSRAAAITSWFLHLAAVKSGNLSAYGVDNLVTIGFFYLMLSPLPDRLALEWRWRRPRPQDRRLLHFFRRVLQLHLCLIYFFGGLTKALGVGWWNGTNLWRALTRPSFDIISADVLVRFKHIFPILGIAVFLAGNRLSILYLASSLAAAVAVRNSRDAPCHRSCHGNVLVRLCHDRIEPGRVWTWHPLEAQAGAGRRPFVLRINDSFA
jgi:uncharacterized membrane protein YphA (DoxX/SURF4 family)